MWSIDAPGQDGYPRASDTAQEKDLEGPSWHPVSRLRWADRSSISSFHLADLDGEAIEPFDIRPFNFQDQPGVN